MRVLIIEDEPDLRSQLQASLEKECFAVDVATDGEEGSLLARTVKYDIILLDHALPKRDGLAVCEDIRRSGRWTPLIFLSTTTEVQSRVDVLNRGADDFLVKPYVFDELLARMRALLRRPTLEECEELGLHDLTLNTRSCLVRRGAKELSLTRKEFMILELLLRHQGMVVSRKMLSEYVWDAQLDEFSNTIESHMANVRRKIDAEEKPSLIQTIPGRGYKMGARRI